MTEKVNYPNCWPNWGRKNVHNFFKIYFIRKTMKKVNIYLIIKVVLDSDFTRKDLSALALAVFKIQ